MTCPACGHELAPAATFCPPCRERGQRAAAAGPTAISGPIVATVRPVAPPRVHADDDPRERFFLIVACLLSAGALAIPRLRRSKAFGPTGKLVLGTLAVLQTALCVAIIASLPWTFPWLMRTMAERLDPELHRRY